MPLGTEQDLDPGHIVLDGAQLAAAPPLFSADVYCGQTVAISATVELLLY